MKIKALLLLILLIVAVCGCRLDDGETQPLHKPSANAPMDASSTGDSGMTKDTTVQETRRVLRYASVAQFQQFRESSGKSQDEKLTGILGILRQELQDPGLPTVGLGGGPIDSGYVLQQGTLNLGLHFLPGLLRQARDKEKEARMRDLLAVALAITGEPSVIEEVRRIAQDHPLGSIRQLAIRGLRKLKDTGSQEILMRALDDRYTSVGGGDVGSGLKKSYPVRREALIALRAIGTTVPAGIVVEVPLPESTSKAGMYAHLLADQDPESCLAAVQLLAAEGDKGRPYLEAFIQKSANEASLKQSIELARKSLQ